MALVIKRGGLTSWELTIIHNTCPLGGMEECEDSRWQDKIVSLMEFMIGKLRRLYISAQHDYTGVWLKACQ